MESRPVTAIRAVGPRLLRLANISAEEFPKSLADESLGLDSNPRENLPESVIDRHLPGFLWRAIKASDSKAATDSGKS